MKESIKKEIIDNMSVLFMDKEKQTNKKSEEISLHHFLSLVKQMNENNEYYLNL